MTIITYGKTVNNISSSRTRRKLDRKFESVKNELVESRIYKVLGLKPVKLPETPRKAEIISKRKSAPPLNMKPIEDYQNQILTAAERLERRNHRIWYKDTNPLGSKIHAVQKSRGKSIPLI